MSSLEPDQSAASVNPRNLKRKRSDLSPDEEVALKVVHLDSPRPNFVKDIPDEIMLTILKDLKGNDLFSLSR